MEVLILSKTKYGQTQVCVGGICVIDKQFIRLLNQGGYYQPADTQFNIGDIWDISFTPVRLRREPHNEDVTIRTYRFVRKIYPLETYIKNMGVPIWRDNIANIFEGKIRWTGNGKGFFSENINNYPSHSVGFWISDIDLRHQKIGNQDLYVYQNNGITRQIVYKGNQEILAIIPRGKLIRLSLAKWWKPEDSDIEARCYLQLSGWYEDQVEPITKEFNMAVKKETLEPPTKREIDIEKNTKKQLIKDKFSIEWEKHLEWEKQNPDNIHELMKRFEKVNTPKNTSGSCYIATLCYNDFYADEVCIFRDFRDNTLNKTKFGRLFVTRYYKFAPKLTKKLENLKVLNKAIKHLLLNPLLIIIKIFKLDKK